MKSSLKRCLTLLPFFPVFSIASPAESCKKLDFLSSGFNLQNAQQCSTLIRRCPPTGPVLDQACVEQVIKENPSCQQLNALAHELNADVASLTVEQIGKIMLVDQLYVADGKHSYYLISSEGCLVKTIIDPRELSVPLKRKYKHKEFMISNTNKPVATLQANGSQSVSVILKITDTCLACDVIGYAKTKFEFSKKGEFVKMKVVGFGDNLINRK